MFLSRKIIINLSCSVLILNKKYENKTMDLDLPVVPLHRYKEHTMDCCKLINSEWKRSETARLRSLESSNDNLPTCLILLKDDRVIGHCKITPIPSIPDGCFIESVVIDKDLRGQGFGSYLMEKVEEYCRIYLHLRIVYLSTKGQELFYGKLGYNECEPISIFGVYVPHNQNPPAVNKNILGSKMNIIKNINSKTYMSKIL